MEDQNKLLKKGYEKLLNGDFQQARKDFHQLLVRHEDWRAYDGLGFALYHEQQYDQAIKAFNQSLALNEYWQSYKGLGFALYHTQQYDQAIKALNQSLALREDWQTYKGLGLVHSAINKNTAANDNECIVAAMKLSIDIEITNSWKPVRRYEYLANSLHELGRAEQAMRASRIYYRQGNAAPCKKVDPFLGEKSGITVTRDFIHDVSEKLERMQFAFHPSYYSEVINDDQLQLWKHLLFIHIPKCAGTNFIEPLRWIIQNIQSNSQGENRHPNAVHKHYLLHGNLCDKFRHDAYLLEAFQGKALDGLSGSFLANHAAKHGAYYQHLREAGITAKKICLVRDPSKRLYSHIRNYGRHVLEKSTLISKYKKELFNTMDKYIYDYDLFEGYDEQPYCEPYDYSKCDKIDFFDLSDSQAISKVKSSFLSATLLPNIVQFDRLNSDNEKTISKGMLGDKDFQDIYKELVSLGCLERDNQIDLEFLKKRTKNRLVFPEIIHKGSILHPITYIHRGSSLNPVTKIMLTKDFIADPIGALNC